MPRSVGRSEISRLARSRRSQPSRLLQRQRLRVEELESRITPSTAQLFAHPFFAFAPDSGHTPSATDITPQQMQTAYGVNLLSQTGAGETIALIDAFSQPRIVSNLASFDSTYGLAAPPSFKLYNQTGGTKLPRGNEGWGLEESLDVEWAHSIAPGAKLIVVNATSSSFANLFAAANEAAKLGANVVSMSFGGVESGIGSANEAKYDKDLNHAGVTYLASSGDSGAPAQYPSASPYVISVGGTTLNINGTTGAYISETVWNSNGGSSGGGPSAYETQPSFEKPVQNTVNSTGKRGTPDVAADADPFTGVSVYDTYYPGGGLLCCVGGTSLASPMWAGIIALANQAKGSNLATAPADIYSLSAGDFHDITSGTNGTYSAGPGYDFATGRGSAQANLLVPALAGLPTAQISHTGTIGGTTGTGQGGVLHVNLSQLSTPGAIPFATTTNLVASPAASSVVAFAAPTAGVAPTTGVQVGGNTASSTDTPILLAHSMPDGQQEMPAAQDTTSTPLPGSIPSLQQKPSGNVGGAQAAQESASLGATLSDSVFTDNQWLALSGNSDGNAEPASEDAGFAIDPVAMAGLMVFLGSYWRSQTAEAESEARRPRKV